MNQSQTAYSFFIGWGVIIALFWGGTKLESTKTIIYYVLWLSIVLLLVTHSQTITNIIQGSGIQEQSTPLPTS